MRYAYTYGVFCVDALPNQPQLAHCHSFFVFEAYRGQGFGHKLKECQNTILCRLGFDYATCTVAESNRAQQKVLGRNGWVMLSRFYNRNTGAYTQLWGYSVPPFTRGDDV